MNPPAMPRKGATNDDRKAIAQQRQDWLKAHHKGLTRAQMRKRLGVSPSGLNWMLDQASVTHTDPTDKAKDTTTAEFNRLMKNWRAA